MSDKTDQFKALHIPGDPLILVNIWDAGSAKAVAAAGAKAIATGSYGVAGAQEESVAGLAGVQLGAAARGGLRVDAGLLGFGWFGARHGRQVSVRARQSLSAGPSGCPTPTRSRRSHARRRSP